MEHEHHHHNYAAQTSKLNRAFIVGIALNLAYAVIEFIFGVYYDSMGLVSDAGHNLSDVLSLVLAMAAFRLAQRHATARFTYGYKKSTILVSLLNAVILFVAVGIIVAESIEKIINPQPVNGLLVTYISATGVAINFFTAWLFLRDKDRDLNVKGAYLHMLADALVSVGVVVSGVAIHFTGWNVIDPIVGIVVAAVIVISTWNLLTASLRLSMDGVPEGIDPDAIRREIESLEGVEQMHHIHIWALSTTENAITAHIVVRDIAEAAHIRADIKHLLALRGISHATIEVETSQCSDLRCLHD